MATNLGFYFDQTVCTGCKACQIACKDKHDTRRRSRAHDHGRGGIPTGPMSGLARECHSLVVWAQRSGEGTTVEFVCDEHPTPEVGSGGAVVVRVPGCLADLDPHLGDGFPARRDGDADRSAGRTGGP